MKEILDDLTEVRPTKYGARGFKFLLFSWLNLCLIIFLGLLDYYYHLLVGGPDELIFLCLFVLFFIFSVLGCINTLKALRKKEKLTWKFTIGIIGSVLFIILFIATIYTFDSLISF